MICKKNGVYKMQYRKEFNSEEFAYAMAYVKMQKIDQIYEDLGEALMIGTIFPELDLPFERGCDNEVCR